MSLIAIQKQAIVGMVGAVDAEVRALIERNIDDIWCAAIRYSCEPTLTFLYAQKEAIDFALMWVAPKISTKKGQSEGYRVSQGAARAKSNSRLDGASQGWTCDWSNTGSYSSHQTNGDSWTRARSETDGESYSFFYSHTWARGQSRSDEQSRADSVRQSNTVRLNEGRSDGGSISFGHSTEDAGNYVPSPFPDPIFQYEPAVSIGICLDPLFNPLSNCNNPIPNPPLNLTLSGKIVEADFVQPFLETPRGCHPTRVGCTVLPNEIECGQIPSEYDTLFENFPRMPLCERENYSASSEVNVNVYIPIPLVGSLSIGGTWATTLESKPRCAQSRASGFSDSESLSTVYMRARAEGRTQARSDGFGFRRNDAHVRAEGNAEGYTNARSATLSAAVTRSETHTGSDTNSHGESQSTSNTETESRSRNTSWQKTMSDRMHQFNIYKYSDIFKALHGLRERVTNQIQQALGAFKVGQFVTGKVRDVSVKRYVPPQTLRLGNSRFTTICRNDVLRATWCS